MELKVLCPTCKGGTADFCGCPTCFDIGYTDPPQQVLDDLECAEIERELLKHGGRVDIHILSDMSAQVVLIHEWNAFKDFVRKTKLEALRKSKEWLDEKDGE